MRDESRQKVLGAAIDLFLQVGPRACSMRQIAQKAGLSLGNAYYHFPSKDHLIQAIYGQMHLEQVQQGAAALEKAERWQDRLRISLEAYLEAIQPYRHFAPELMSMAASPSSALNPFSPESAPIRKACFEHYQRVLAPMQKKTLPFWIVCLTWCFQMGLTVFWTYDTSRQQTQTRKLLQICLPFLIWFIQAAKVPGTRTFLKPITQFLGHFEGSPDVSKNG
ncbi:MAG: TetR/AcrR family transcriptional regulator [Acidobacteria bacterium]|nr:TetR/AcrR family transcriptional regulator [Acidobacteriota bacterium]